MTLHLTGPALRFSETSRSLQPARQVNAVVRPLEGTSVGHLFDLKTGSLAVGDPTMGLTCYALALPPGAYRLGPRALRAVFGQAAMESAQPLIRLDAPCVFALDAALVEDFTAWYHQVGTECAYMALTLAQRLAEFEAAAGARVGFYWEEELAGRSVEGQYVLDLAGILKQAEPDASADWPA